MKKLPSPEVAQDPIVNARRGTISGGPESLAGIRSPVSCWCCRRGLRLMRKKKKFCWSRCRLLYWAAGEIIKEWRAGSASGLVKLMREISQRESPENE